MKKHSLYTPVPHIQEEILRQSVESQTKASYNNVRSHNGLRRVEKQRRNLAYANGDSCASIVISRAQKYFGQKIIT